MIICPEKTAIKNSVSKSTKIIETLMSKDKEILDYGCGKLRNTKYLKKQGFTNISVIDTETQINSLSKKELQDFWYYNSPNQIKDNTFDCVLCSFVLNVLLPDVRKEVIKEIERVAKDIIILEVRTDNDLKSTKNKVEYEDGYLIGKGKIKTFQKPFNTSNFISFIKENTSLNIIEIKKYSNSLIMILKK